MKEVNGFPNYLVNEFGEVFSKKRKMKKRKTGTDTQGYETVALWNKGKTRLLKVHRIVAEAFIPNPNNYPIINHKDLNKKNNHVDNLEWCTYSYNNSYGGDKSPISTMATARSKSVVQIKNGMIVAIYKSASEAQRKTGIWQSNISKCCLHQKKFNSAGGYQWEFYNK